MTGKKPRTKKQLESDKKLAEANKGTRFKSGVEAVSKGRKGGIESQRKQREERTVAEKFKIILNLKHGEGEPTDIGELKDVGELEIANLTLGDDMILEVVKLARKGNVKAAELVWRMTSQMPSEKTEVTITEKPADEMNIDELAATIKKSKKAKE